MDVSGIFFPDPLHEGFQSGRGQRTAAVIALNLVATLCPEKLQLFGRFDAFGNHLHAERMSQCDGCFDDGCHVAVIDDIGDEQTVDFQIIGRQGRQVTE